MDDPKSKVYGIGILRVSTVKQGLMGDSPEDQKRQILRRAEQLSQMFHSYVLIRKWFNYTESASGDFENQPILKALEFCKNPKNKIRYCFIKSIDRGTRGGSTIYGRLKSQFLRYGVQLIDVYGVIGTQTINTLDHLNVKYNWSEFSPTEITELLEAERAKGEVRDILTRMIGAEISYVRMGYHVRYAPPGFKNQKVETLYGMRVILIPEDIEAPWFIQMFELRAPGIYPDEEIVEKINLMGYKSRITKIHDPLNKKRVIGYRGCRPLTVKQFRRFIQNPIYAGINVEKWTNGQAVECKFPGLVSIDQFNKANKGKIVIIKDNRGVKVIKGHIDSWQIKKLKINPLFPYKQYVLCPVCKNPLLGSSPRNKAGKHIARYHCARGHRYWSINKKIFDETILNFVSELKFSKEFGEKFREIILEEWEKRRIETGKDSIILEKRVLLLKNERQLIIGKLKLITSIAAIRAMEDELEKKDQEIAQAMAARDKKEMEEIDIQTVISHVLYFMEHLQDLIIGGSDPLKNAAMFGLLFEELPTYDDLKNGTPKLAPIFNLNNQYAKNYGLSVSDQGLEP